MSVSLTIHVTLAHFIKTNVNHPSYICNIIKTNVNHPNYICDIIKTKVNQPNYICNIIKTNVNHPNYICNINPFYKKLMSIILTIYVTLAHYTKN
jgi:hypothetical protein